MTTLELQKLLNKNGAGLIVEDGIPGNQTTEAVKRFQSMNGLTPDGIVGPKTLAKLGGSVLLITAQMLKSVIVNLTIEKAEEISKVINEVCPLYGITTKDILHEFIANIAHESGGFRIKEENMNYTTPDRLVTIWPSRFTTTGEKGKLNAKDYVKNPKKLANEVYSRRMGNGSPESGDGYNFRGRGPIQLTGRESYQAFYDFKLAGGGRKIALPKTLEELADLVTNDLYWGIESACWEFSIDKKLVPLAVGTLEKNKQTIRKRINGALTGYSDVQDYTKRAEKYIV